MNSLFTAMLLAIIPMVGVILAITPWLMPRNECFAVTIPESAADDPRFKGIKARYAAIVLVVSIALLAWTIPASSDLSRNGVNTFLVRYIAAVMVPVIVGFALMLLYRNRVQAIKAREGWAASAQLSTAAINEQDIPRPFSLRWNVLYIPVLVLSVGIICFLYPMMPADIPMQVDFGGTVTRSVAKTPLTASFPIFLEVFFAIIFVFSHWMSLKSKRPTNPKAPATSAYAYASFLNAQCIMLLVTGLALCAATGIFIPLAFAGILTMLQSAAAFVFVAIVIVVGFAFLSIKYGQNGSRLFRRMEACGGMPADNDRFWKLGVFYVNPSDASIFVPKRFGVGWTVNFGSPKAWLTIIGLVVLIAVFAWVCEALF